MIIVSFRPVGIDWLDRTTEVMRSGQSTLTIR